MIKINPDFIEKVNSIIENYSFNNNNQKNPYSAKTNKNEIIVPNVFYTQNIEGKKIKLFFSNLILKNILELAKEEFGIQKWANIGKIEKNTNELDENELGILSTFQEENHPQHISPSNENVVNKATNLDFSNLIDEENSDNNPEDLKIKSNVSPNKMKNNDLFFSKNTWTQHEDFLLMNLSKTHLANKWSIITKIIHMKSKTQCIYRLKKLSLKLKSEYVNMHFHKIISNNSSKEINNLKLNSEISNSFSKKNLNNKVKDGSLNINNFISNINSLDLVNNEDEENDLYRYKPNISSFSDNQNTKSQENVNLFYNSQYKYPENKSFINKEHYLHENQNLTSNHSSLNMNNLDIKQNNTENFEDIQLNCKNDFFNHENFITSNFQRENSVYFSDDDNFFINKYQKNANQDKITNNNLENKKEKAELEDDLKQIDYILNSKHFNALDFSIQAKILNNIILDLNEYSKTATNSNHKVYGLKVQSKILELLIQITTLQLEIRQSLDKNEKCDK